MKFRMQLLLVLVLTIFSASYSQEISKFERKNLKKEIKNLLKNPAKYKEFKKTLSANETIVKEQSSQLISLNLENSKNKSKLNFAKDSIKLCTAKIDELNKEFKTFKSKDQIDNKGMQFKLQIGKFKEFDISSLLEKKKLLSFEKDKDGTVIYTIGNFETEYDAELFKNSMREIGVKDAFVSYYLNGKRIAKD